MVVTAAEPGQMGVISKGRRSWLERVPAWVQRLVTIGVLADDPEEERLRKASLTLTTTIVSALAIVWVTTYSVLGLYLSAAIPFGYQVISIGSLVVLARTRRFEFFRTSQLSLMLVLPAVLQWSLGGFVVSSGVMLWSLVAPLGALAFSRRPLPWFSGYLVLTVALGVAEAFLTPAPIPASVTVVFFVLNIGGVSTVVYFLLRYFMRGLALEQEKSERLLLNVLARDYCSTSEGGGAASR